MLIVRSQSMDVYRNLAVEEYLMEHALGHGPVLFLWRSRCAVVVGKNQNPWRECRLDRMQTEEVPLARRTSGGGAVYHDTGNLNYCVIVDRKEYREQQAYDMVLAALERFGINAERTGKSNLSTNGLKFSGNAFCFRKGAALHHGTLLLSTDIDRLNRYLGSMCDGIETHAIASVPAEVVNLELSLDELTSALKDSFRQLYRGAASDPVEWGVDELSGKDLEDLFTKQRSDEWKYGATPRFALDIGGTRLDVSRGVVVRAEGPLREAVEGKPFAEVALSRLCSID